MSLHIAMVLGWVFFFFCYPTYAHPKPTGVFVANQPIEWHWPDGRKARLTVRRYGPVYVEFGADLTDNTCSDVTQSTCSFGTGMKFYRVGLEWIENPIDPSRVGQVVRQGPVGSDIPVQIGFIASMMKKHFLQLPYDQDIPNDFIKCNDWSWFDGQTIEAPSVIDSPQWWGETMYENQETGVNENMVFGTLSNVFWDRVDSKTIRVSRIEGRYTSIYGLLDDFIYQSVTSLLIRKPGGFCQAAFKPNMVAYISSVSEAPKLTTESINYKYQQDNLYETWAAADYSNGRFLFSSTGEPYEVR